MALGDSDGLAFGIGYIGVARGIRAHVQVRRPHRNMRQNFQGTIGCLKERTSGRRLCSPTVRMIVDAVFSQQDAPGLAVSADCAIIVDGCPGPPYRSLVVQNGAVMVWLGRNDTSASLSARRCAPSPPRRAPGGVAERGAALAKPSPVRWPTTRFALVVCIHKHSLTNNTTQRYPNPERTARTRPTAAGGRHRGRQDHGRRRPP